MPLNYDWEERRPRGLSSKFKNREMLWLWCQLVKKGYSLNENLVSDFHSRANHLIDKILEKDEETVDDLKRHENNHSAGRLNDSEFKWIDYNDKRLVFWVTGRINEGCLFAGAPVTPFDQSVLMPKERIELAFDLSLISVRDKMYFIQHLRRDWSSLIEIDPSLDWINRKDEDQCRWLVSEIQSSDLAPWISLALQSPVNNDDRFLLFVNTLDRSRIPLKLKRLFLGELKSKWSRKQRKLDTTKVQCNLNVDSLTKERIKRLSRYRSLKMGELIDALVAEEVERLRAKDVLL